MSTGSGGRFELMDDVGYLLARSSGMAIRETNERLAELGLRVRQYSVLSVACDSGGISQRALSDLLGLDPSQIVALADELEERGLVERLPDPRDRRARLITPTEEGRVLYARAAPAAGEGLKNSLGPLSDAECQTLRDLLRRVVEQDPADLP